SGGTPISPVLDCDQYVLHRRDLMTFFAFIAAMALAILAHEIGSAVQTAVIGRWNNPLNTPILTHSDLPGQRRRTTLEAILLAVFPRRFDERHAANVADVVG